MDSLILVDEHDNPIGTMEKMEAHQKGALHRAFSVLVFNSAGDLLLQQRSNSKYHSGGLWTNTCCSHPAPNESTEDAARIRLKHEMGIDLQPKFAFKFIYKADLDRDLVEHEYDHVFTATYDGTPIANKDEVASWKFMNVASLRSDMENAPEKYTPWFKLIMDRFKAEKN